MRKTRPSAVELGRFAEAAVALGIASIAIRFWSFNWIVRSLKARGEGRAVRVDPAAIAQAVQRASRRLPWRTVCFHQALAVYWMLSRRGIASRLHYGLRNDAERLSAHVWVTVAGQPVIGQEEASGHRHAPVAIFPPALLDG